MTAKYLNTRSFVIALLVIGGAFAAYRILPSIPKSVADINANPQVLNGRRFHKGDLPYLNIQNVHIRGLVFDDIQADGSRFKNVTFEKCSFTLVNFQSCRFENVAFKNCVIRGWGNPRDINNTTIFRYSVFKNVLFENTKMRNVMADSISGEGGYVCFRNMRDVRARGGDDGNLLVGYDLYCRVVDSDFAKAAFLVGDEDSSFYARNSTFSKLSLQTGRTYIENCDLIDISMSSSKGAVVKDSLLDGTSMSLFESSYFDCNRYIDSGEPGPFLLSQKRGNIIFGRDNSPVYVVHQDAAPALLGFSSGHVTAANITLRDPVMINQAGERKESLSLNLRNVRILGGYWHF
jgi:uncharacterized protein YjbI with pentapeptide repeats